MRRSLCLLFALTAPGLTQDDAFPQQKESPSTIFVVIPRDKDTHRIITDANVWVGWDEGEGVRFFMQDSGDGAVEMGLARGTYNIRVTAPGHETLTIEDITVEKGTSSGWLGSCGQSFVSSYAGPTVVIGAALRPTPPGHHEERVIRWLPDSEYYWRTDVPPEPIGGVQSITQKLDFSKARPTDNPYYKGFVRAGVYIDKTGAVKRVDFDEALPNQDLPEDVQETLRKAITNTRFTPATMLGKIVRSHLEIPFDLEIHQTK